MVCYQLQLVALFSSFWKLHAIIVFHPNIFVIVYIICWKTIQEEERFLKTDDVVVVFTKRIELIETKHSIHMYISKGD